MSDFKTQLALSKDYKKLYELVMKLGELPGCYGVPCFVNYRLNAGEEPARYLRDIADVRYWPNEQRISVGSRGIGRMEVYPDKRNRNGSVQEEFEAECKYYDLEWVDTAAQTEELELLRMQLAACGTAAATNTEKSKEAQRIGKDSPYFTASYQDVCRAVDMEIQHRNDLAAAQWVIEQIKVAINLDMGDASLEAINKILNEYNATRAE